MKIVTHNGGFHADDVFATAALTLLYPDARVVRSRDDEVITSGDIVIDVGGKCDPGLKRFDHHQSGGAGIRENGIPYAAFGLVWREYGEEIAGSRHIQAIIDETIASPIDAIDNGVDISKPVYPGVREYNISSIISSFLPQLDDDSPDDKFNAAVSFARDLLLREINNAKIEAADSKELVSIAKKASGPILVLDRFMRGKDVLIDFPSILYVVYPGRPAWGDNRWYVKTVRKSADTFESKRLLPSAWAGKNGKELEEASGVKGALFCHKGRFLTAAQTKEGAIKLANEALKI
jgi:uncharacterized UPF0160 family protein